MLIAWVVAAAVVTPAGLAAPDRLTAGPANQYLGALTADGRELYFASDEESTTQLYVQDVQTGVPRLAFDEVADVTWPRPSPDGRHLLYISYRDDAAGELCLRQILGAPGARRFGARHCLTAPGSAELQAVWFPDSRSIALVTRPGLHGDFELRQVAVGGTAAQPTLTLGARLAEGSLANPAVAPDGRSLVAVPVQRGSRQVGPSFLGRSTGALQRHALAGTTGAAGAAGTTGAAGTAGTTGAAGAAGAAVRLSFDLPGKSAMPAFSTDGRWLYFSQFLNDTNFDGAIDGNDHGVLFRAALSGDTVGAPEQLSSARWSCQYPLPTRDRLVATCLVAGSLDVFSLPPGGALPAAWATLPVAERHQRIDDELSASRDRWERLLLLSHRGARPRVAAGQIQGHQQVRVGLHRQATLAGAQEALMRDEAPELMQLRALRRGAG